MLTRTCTECNGVFTQTGKGRARDTCYKESCILARKQRWSRGNMQRVKQMKVEGRWKAHLRQTKGLGRGSAKLTDIERVCLKCDRKFKVPVDTDWRICPKCHVENDRLLGECEASALGAGRLGPGSLVGIGRAALPERAGIAITA